MEKEQVIAILEFFRDAENRIADNHGAMRDIEEQYYHSASGIHISGMPVGKGVPSNPVEQMALHSIDRNARQQLCYLRLQNSRIQAVKLEIRREMDKLSYQQRAILTKFYIEHLYWAKIARQVHFSVRQCKNIRNAALRNLGKYFSANPVISAYSFPES